MSVLQWVYRYLRCVWVPEATVIGLDVSPEALQLAQQNAMNIGADRVQWVQETFLTGLKDHFNLFSATLRTFRRLIWPT